MKKSLLFVLVCLFISSSFNNKNVLSADDGTLDVSTLVNEFYNNGVYTKKSNIHLDPLVLEELAKEDIKAFHGKVDLERTTYYQKDNEGKDLLFMVNLDSTFTDGINSGYRTITNLDGTTYMDHFVYDGTSAIRTYKTNISSVEDYYVTLFDMLEKFYFDGWVYENNLYKYDVTDVEDSYFKDFLAFTAPCLEEVFFSESTKNYFTVDEMYLTISKHNNNFGEYLSLKMYVTGDGLDNGYVTSSNGLLSEARIYKGTKVFNEKDVNIKGV